MKRGDMFACLMEEYGSQEENMNEDPVTDKQAGSSAVAGEAKKATQKLMQDEDPKRCEEYRKRARDFAVEFIRYFDEEGTHC